MKKSDKAIALGLVLGVVALLIAALAAGPAAAADPTTGFQAAKFKVEVKGTQDSVVHYTREAEDACGVSDFSIGKEHLVFHTAKPIVITAFEAPGGGFNPEFFAGKQLGVPTVASLHRSFDPMIDAPSNPGCGENGGADTGVEEAKPDCGTRRLKFPVNLQYGYKSEDGLLLSSGLTEETLFKLCPQTAATESFAWLLVQDTAGKGIYAQLSQKELFDPAFGKWISIAEGTRKRTTPDETRETKIHWEVSFTRLKN